jgi:hypothetical protein
VKILIAKGNGFIYSASIKKSYHKNGTAKTAGFKCKRKAERLNKFYLTKILFIKTINFNRFTFD